jgi:hypothetical protein
MSDYIDLSKLDPILLAIKDMTFDGRPALEAMRTDPVVYEAVRRIVLSELEKIAYDPDDGDVAREGNAMLLEIFDKILSKYGPDSST